MFPTASPYSPFFTSGLLFEPHDSRPASPDFPLGPRRGSLPTDSTRPPSTEDASAFYFTLQPKRDPIQYRSFLSLDLAESQSLRSASLKRKQSARSKRSSRLDISKHPTIPEVASSSPLRARYSRDSLRTLPSPKPAPSLTLPELPVEARSPRTSNPPRLPSLPPLPSLEIPLKPVYASCSVADPRASCTSKAKPLQRISVLTQATSSTVSTRVKKSNRSDALARLEGRSKAAAVPSVKQPVQQRNFMSMSDDEDDSDHESLDFFDDDDKMGFTLIEPEDIVLPSVADLVASQAAAHTRKSSLASRRRRNNNNRSTKDWHPLKSFIDLRNDDEPSRWSWRSFIEVAAVV